jgi:hypothetical protein
MTAIQTRDHKAPVSLSDLDQAWRQTGLRLGVSRERIDVLRHQPKTPLPAAEPRDVLAALTELDATFAARDARAVALERSAGAPIHNALDQLRGLRASDEILVLADRTGTTRQHRGQERAVVAITVRPRSSAWPPHQGSLVELSGQHADRDGHRIEQTPVLRVLAEEAVEDAPRVARSPDDRSVSRRPSPWPR